MSELEVDIHNSLLTTHPLMVCVSTRLKYGPVSSDNSLQYAVSVRMSELWGEFSEGLLLK